MAAVLRLDGGWLPDEPLRVGDLAVERGRDNILMYDDGITLRVIVLDPAVYATAGGLIAAARGESVPGHVVLVSGAVPIGWRASLRQAEVSYVDVGSSVAEIAWPRLRLSSGRFSVQAVERHREPVPLQKGHALVAQELVVAAAGGKRLTITELARQAGSSVSTASRAVAQLAAHGLVERQQNWREVAVGVPDPAELADLLATRTAWPGTEVVSGYAWGRTIWDMAAVISRNAAESGIPLAVTGRVGAAFLGIFGTSSPAEVRCWATVNGQSLSEVAGLLGLEPAPSESANVRLSADSWRIGVHRRAEAHYEGWTATVAHPLRVWCDLHGEQRGGEFAAQLWGKVSNAW